MKIRYLALAVVIALTGTVQAQTMTELPCLQTVSREMTDPDYWLRENGSADTVLADADAIQERNQSFIDTDACMMQDLSLCEKYFNEKKLYNGLWHTALSEASGLLSYYNYDMDGNVITGPVLNELLANIGGEEAREQARLRYGICVRRTDVVALPSDFLATDEEGDVDYNFYQMSALRVNEPVTVLAVSKDEKYYYCNADCVSGWAKAEDIALCEDKEEWMKVWQIPQKESVVITCGKLYLEDSNINPGVSERMLTMGTVLRKVTDEEYDAAVTGRQPVYNYAVWLPVRQDDGSYARTIALVPERDGVSEGYLPLTSRNILHVAFSRLGDVYGWGSMLKSVDCSNYIRDIYKCFGLAIPRNTTWQSAMPVYKFDVSEMDDDAKKEVLDTLPAGAVLYFNGHEMMYLGHLDDQYYVISAVSSMVDPASGEVVKLRGVVINSLDAVRLNGNTWLGDLNLMLLPYLPEDDFYEQFRKKYFQDQLFAFVSQYYGKEAILTLS